MIINNPYLERKRELIKLIDKSKDKNSDQLRTELAMLNTKERAWIQNQAKIARKEDRQTIIMEALV